MINFYYSQISSNHKMFIYPTDLKFNNFGLLHSDTARYIFINNFQFKWLYNFNMLQVIIEGIVGSNIYGDIAIDDLSFSNGACGLSPAKARPRSATTTTVPPTTTRTVTATSSKAS